MRGRLIATTAAAALFAAAVASAQPAPASTDKADALSAAARSGDAAAVKALLDEGVDVNTKYRYGVTVLIYACDHGHLDVVKLLVDRGADVNVKDSFYGATPLMMAVSPAQKRKPAHLEIAKLLLAHGAMPEGRSVDECRVRAGRGHDEGGPGLWRHCREDPLCRARRRPRTTSRRRSSRCSRRPAPNPPPNSRSIRHSSPGTPGPIATLRATN